MRCWWVNVERNEVAVVRCPNARIRGWLKQTLLKTMSLKVQSTDMTLLSALSEEFKTRVTLLRIAQKKDSVLYAQYGTEEAKMRNWSTFNLFGGIFDTAPLGMLVMG